MPDRSGPIEDIWQSLADLGEYDPLDACADNINAFMQIYAPHVDEATRTRWAREAAFFFSAVPPQTATCPVSYSLNQYVVFCLIVHRSDASFRPKDLIEGFDRFRRALPQIARG